MGIREELAVYVSATGTQCRVTKFLSSLPESKRVELTALLAERDFTSTAFEKWALDKHNVRVSDQTWARHRRGKCTCGSR